MSKLETELAQIFCVENRVKFLLEICSKFEGKLKTEKRFSSAEFEGELRKEFGFGYQSVKAIINALFDAGQNLCLVYVYALTNPSGINQWTKKSYEALTNGTDEDKMLKNLVDEIVENSPHLNRKED